MSTETKVQDLTSLSHMVRDKPNNHTKGREILLVNTAKSVLNPPFQTPLKSLLLAHPNPGCQRCGWLQHLQEMQPKEQLRQTVSLCQLVNTGVQSQRYLGRSFWSILQDAGWRRASPSSSRTCSLPNSPTTLGHFGGGAG